jgi:fluoride exporter
MAGRPEIGIQNVVMLWKNVLLVALGGSVGCVARFLCQKWVSDWHAHPFPWATFGINIVGSFLIGLFYSLSEKGQWLTPEWRILLTTGFCGGFTTFSTFAFENISLLKNGDLAWFLLYSIGSVVLGIVACYLGIVLAK